MLNLDVNVGVEVRTIRVPYTFTRDNICSACGTEGSLAVVNIFGKEERTLDIHPMDYIRCRNCGFNYSIRWDPDEEGKMRPVPINRSIKAEFNNLLDYKRIKENGNTDI